MHLALDWEVIVKVQEYERDPNLVSLCYLVSKNSEMKFSLSLLMRLSLNGRSDPSHGHEQDHIKCGAVTVFLSLPHRTITVFTSAETAAADISPALYGAKLAKVLGECRLRPPLSRKIDQRTELQLVSDVESP